MLTKKEIDAMNIAFDFSNPVTIARVPFEYQSTENFALECVYYLIPYIAEKLNIDYSKVVLVAISKDNKVVVFSVASRDSDWLFYNFNNPSRCNAQLYDDVEPELIIEKTKRLYTQN